MSIRFVAAKTTTFSWVVKPDKMESPSCEKEEKTGSGRNLHKMDDVSCTICFQVRFREKITNHRRPNIQGETPWSCHLCIICSSCTSSVALMTIEQTKNLNSDRKLGLHKCKRLSKTNKNQEGYLIYTNPIRPRKHGLWKKFATVRNKNR